MRRIPIVTFMNKLDRAGQDPLDLMDEIERILGIPCHPVTWPIGSGPDFQGVYDRWGKSLLKYERGDSAKGERVAPVQVASLHDSAFIESLGAAAHATLMEELELLESGHDFDQATFLAGGVTPVFFGSASNDFGVEPFLKRFLELAPAPLPRKTTTGQIDPLNPSFSGFVFKIQANMDPAHRDRIAFLRIVSGKFTRGMEVLNPRTGRTLKLAKPLQFLAQERTLVEEAWAGDILGLWDAGNLRIGDSLAEGPGIEFEGIPRFSPEFFNRVVMLDPAKRKQLKKGLDQLSEEGAVQVFHDPDRMERDPVLGAVGVLQFEVIQHRLRSEYGAEISYARLPFTLARWVEGEDFDPTRFDDPPSVACLVDLEGRPLVLFQSKWHLERAERENPKLRFIAAVQPGRAKATA
jgi:peptide chain release factor 3